jgi:hypothetical protein
LAKQHPLVVESNLQETIHLGKYFQVSVVTAWLEPGKELSTSVRLVAVWFRPILSAAALGLAAKHPNSIKVEEPTFGLPTEEAVDGKSRVTAAEEMGKRKRTYAEALEVSKRVKDAKILIRSKVDVRLA